MTATSSGRYVALYSLYLWSEHNDLIKRIRFTCTVKINILLSFSVRDVGFFSNYQYKVLYSRFALLPVLSLDAFRSEMFNKDNLLVTNTSYVEHPKLSMVYG